jgi:hypothetical protein
MKSQYDQDTDMYTGRYLEASYSYWSALLTFNGIVLAFFSADVFLNPYSYTFLNYVLIAICFASIVLVIFNYRSIRQLYFELGGTTEADLRELIRQGQNEEIARQDANSFKNKQLRDQLLDVFLFFESLLLIVIFLVK